MRIGDQELALLTFIAERGSATVGEVAEEFGGPRNLARSTVLTMMERLRQKRRLTRKRVDGVFRYSSPNSRKDVLNEVVTDFVEKTLGGSLSPFVAYLTRIDRRLRRRTRRTGTRRREPAEAEEGVMTAMDVMDGIPHLLWTTSWQAGVMAGAIWLACRQWPRMPANLRVMLWWLVSLKFVIGLVWTQPIPLPVLPASLASASDSITSATEVSFARKYQFDRK